MAVALVGALLRLASEKLDVMRSCAASALGRLLHNVRGEYPLAGVEHLAALRAIVPPPVEGGVTGAPEDSDVSGSLLSKWFRTVIPVLSVEGYAAPMMAGLVTSVGGLSESVVKHASSALVEWATSTSKRGEWRRLESVATALLDFLRGSVVPSSSEAGPEPGSPGGTGAVSTGTAKTVIQARLVVPTLRTLTLLLESGCLEVLQAPKSSFASSLVSLTRMRCAKSGDAIRVMEGAAVLLGALSFEPPVRTEALVSLLDLLCHDFPKVRKTTAERLHIRILTIEDKFPGVAVDSVLALLTETAWMGPLEGCLGPRDALYPLLDIPVPAVRMGVSRLAGQDHGAGAGARTGAGSRGETYDSYGALVKEAGY